QGSGGITPFTEEQIAAASALIVAADVNVSGRARIAGPPLVEDPVKRATYPGPQMVHEAVAAASEPAATRRPAGGAAAKAPRSAGRQAWPRRLQGAVMTGVSYMIPFVAAGGLLMALGFLIGGFDVAFVAQDVATGYLLSSLPGAQEYDGATGPPQTDRAGPARH